MADEPSAHENLGTLFANMVRWQGEAAKRMFEAFLPPPDLELPDRKDFTAFAEAAAKLQEQWLSFHSQQPGLKQEPPPLMADPEQWLEYLQAWYRQMPGANPERQAAIWEETLALWERILAEYEAHEGATDHELPLKDKRFRDPRWRSQPAFALIHQTYLMMCARLTELVDEAEGLDQAQREQLRFATRASLDALSPANFPLLNPLVIDRTIEEHGQNLVKGMERFARDLESGQLTHTDKSAFRLGENIAATPGKVIHETRLYQLIQYSPATAEVIETPLVIFPPWINRFYILDLNPAKSFVKWAVDQGLSVFMVSWKSADESLADVTWDHYIRAQIEVIDHVRARLAVPAVHTIGYCVAGTTLAATLAILARRGEAEKVASATFFTAQVDFEKAGELKVFIDDNQLELVRRASEKGYLDGRYMAATFNLLRGTDLIWNYVVNNYLMGEDYPAFDLLYWNGDVTNLPARWHSSYLQDLYRDNLLVVPDALSGDGTPIDLRRIATPTYVQAGREDHIAPAESVFRLTDYLAGPVRFVLAGSGHIAGVVNPPAAGKYQYWTNDGPFADLASFLAGAKEHPGSWWGDWIGWIESLSGKRVPARGKRRPGGRGDKAIEDAPGRYVTMR